MQEEGEGLLKCSTGRAGWALFEAKVVRGILVAG